MLDEITIANIVSSIGAIVVIWGFTEKVVKSNKENVSKIIDPIKKDINMLLKIQHAMITYLRKDGDSIEMDEIATEFDHYLIDRVNGGTKKG